MTGRARWGGTSCVLMVFTGLAAGCIIPDRDIQVQEDFGNPGAVRIVQPTPITGEADLACGERDTFLFCPTVSDTLPSGELKGNGDLCICPARDDNAPRGFQIFVEDPDVDADGRPRDEIFGAFLLDVPADATDLSAYQAYTNAMPPDEPARLFSGEVRTIERDTPGLRVFQVGGFTGDTFDVCNDDERTKEGAGIHELRFIATDRPWFAPLDPNGGTGEDAVRADPLIGIPDLPGGATYASTAFVFRCIDSAGPDGGGCGCFDPDDPT